MGKSVAGMGKDALGNRRDLLGAVHALRVHPILVSTRADFVRTLEGEAGLQRLAAELSPAARAYLEGRIDPFLAQPVAPLLEIDEALLGGPFHGDARWFRRLGAQGGRALTESLLRTFLVVSAGSHDRALAHLARLFGRFYENGDAMVVDQTDSQATIEGRGVVLPAHFCDHLIPGWGEMALVLGGARRVEVTMASCLHRGDAACRWSLDFA